MNRLFIALPIDDLIITNLKPVYNTLSAFSDVLKVVEPAQYHLTLKFIGECEGNVAHAIEKAFGTIAIQLSSLEYTVKGIGMFPNSKNPSVLWTGIITNEKAMNQLAKQMESFVKQFGIKEENRPFVPHLTLARIRKGRKLTEKINEKLKSLERAEFGSAVFNRIVLFSSKLTPTGPIYTQLREINFS
ncbi:MAG: RNA 2',3'-cyclic phosphodiesterase [Spirochaetes bacterium]|nr:RNA 2',3'-cyclic phosphodiesterase [Spirochaetota bacterium]